MACLGPVLSKLYCACGHLNADSDAVGPEWDVRLSVCKTFPDDATASNLWTAL